MSEEEGWQQQLEAERYRSAVDALSRCAKAGAKVEDLKTLAHECGVDFKHVSIGGQHATNQ